MLYSLVMCAGRLAFTAPTLTAGHRTAWIYLRSDLSGMLMRTGLDHASHLILEEIEVGKSVAWHGLAIFGSWPRVRR